MKKIFLSLFLVLSLSLSAQIHRGLKGNIALDSFPKMSFVWNSTKTDFSDASRFTLLEDNIPVELELDNITIANDRVLNKSVLILWEDMASHGRQSNLTRKLLKQFFSDFSIAQADRFEIAVFGRKENDENLAIERLVGSFTSDTSLLFKALSVYKNNQKYYYPSPYQSSLYQAIDDGLDILKKEPVDRTGVIIVVTAGLDYKTNGSITEMEVRQNAIEAGIPIYVVKYPFFEDQPEINILAEKTSGFVISSDNFLNVSDSLKWYYINMDFLLWGVDYQISFKSNCERDGKLHSLRFMVDKVQQFQLMYETPDATFGMWLLKNWWLVIFAILLLVGFAVLMMYIVRKKKEEHKQETESIKKQMRRERAEIEKRYNQELEVLKHEQRNKEQAAKETFMRERDAANDERLSKLMHTKNLIPRLKCISGKDVFTFTITKPRITLGRDNDNDVVFNNQTVSGLHAEIVFNGSEFIIINKSHSYSQGIVINGQLHQEYSLHNGDMIGLGEIVITFYI